MRVIYDISALGKGFYHPRARTGVFRVIENLAQELLKAQAISSFSSALSVGSYFECADYLQSNSTLAGFPLAKPGVSQEFLSIYQYLNARTHKNKSPHPYIREFYKLANGAANRIFVRKTINRNVLASAEIYHSPFYPIPEQIKRSNTLKKVITVYDLIPVLYPKFFKNQQSGLIHDVLKSIDKDTWVTCISQATKNDLCNYLPSLDPSRVFVTHLAASALFYQCQDQAMIENIRVKFGIPEGQYMLSLSTLEPRKNIIQTIRCFTRLVKEGSIKDISLVLAGIRGWDFDDIFNEIAASPEIRERIIVTGYVSDKDMAPLYSGAIMFVYPSFYEGFGLPPLEAMQCGVPVITSNTSSLPEVVGEAGMMVDPQDADELCQAMLKIYNSAEARQKMSLDSLAQAQKFSWKRCAEQTIDTYKAAKAG
jgi:glycosyltransferase involved in cell wall biosynthesis